jgi:hypothetical protein
MGAPCTRKINGHYRTVNGHYDAARAGRGLVMAHAPNHGARECYLVIY